MNRSFRISGSYSYTHVHTYVKKQRENITRGIAATPRKREIQRDPLPLQSEEQTYPRVAFDGTLAYE